MPFFVIIDVMNTGTALRKTYDHRVREVVCSTQDPTIFPMLSIPRSTASGWLSKGPRPVVSVDTLSKTHQELQVEVLRLQRRIQILTAIMRLLMTLLKVSGFRLDQSRVTDGSAKEKIIGAVEKASKSLPRRSIFKVLQLEPTRYYSWKRHTDCGLDDQTSCPHTSPTQLIIRLLNGAKAYLHAVIDNHSRKILSWTVAEHLDIESTCTVLLEAAKFLEPRDPKTPTLICDSGTETVNRKVDELILSGLFRRILAQVEVAYSNSMIEAFWRSIRHQWLYLNNLADIATVRRLTCFYVQQHNEVMPHSAFKGQTPDEVYAGKGEGVLIELAKARELARATRLKANRELECGQCPVKGKQ